MSVGLYWNSIRREARGSRRRVVFLLLCLTVGVGAVVAVATAIDAFDDALRAQSRELLGADLVVSSRRPLASELDAIVAQGVTSSPERSDLLELPTMATSVDAGGKTVSRLVRLEAAGGRFPLHGHIRLEGGVDLNDALTAETVAVAPELLDALGIPVGARLRLGTAEFQVAGAIEEATDRIDFSTDLAPRAIVRADGLARSGLLQFGSRVRYRALFRLPDETTAASLGELREKIAAELPGSEYVRVETHDEAQPSLRRALARVGDFLGLVALLSLLLGGIGVAQVVRVWLATRTRSIAIRRSIGMRPREIARLYVGFVLVVAVGGALLGCAFGTALPAVAVELLPNGSQQLELNWWQPGALARGVGLGLSVALLFSIGPLAAVWNVSPALVLRSTATSLSAPWWARGLLVVTVVTGVFICAWLQGGRVGLAAGFTTVLCVSALALFAGARLVMFVVGRLPRDRLGPYLRHGLAALARPGAGTVGATVALGLGILVVVTILLVEAGLGEQLERQLPRQAPSVYLWDVQAEQEGGVREILQSHGAERVTSVPVAMARLSEVDGRSVGELLEDRSRGRGRGTLRREHRMTWLDALPESNRLLRGTLWSDPDVDEVSLESSFADRLGVDLGARLKFDLQGVPFEVTVTSIRSVEWQSFDINFFMVVEPGVLNDAPHFRMVGVRLDAAQESPVQNALAEEFPNVTVFRLRAILEKLTEVLERLAFGVKFLGSFTVLVGLIVLAGAVSATTWRRERETALLRTLGLTSRGVLVLLAFEYSLLGAVAGGLGAAGGCVLAYGFLGWVLELEVALPYALLVPVAAGTVGLVVGCGLWATRRARRVEPVRVLRG